MFDILITVNSPGLYALVPVRELEQLHKVLIVTAEEIAPERWDTNNKWMEATHAQES